MATKKSKAKNLNCKKIDFSEIGKKTSVWQNPIIKLIRQLKYLQFIKQRSDERAIKSV